MDASHSPDHRRLPSSLLLQHTTVKKVRVHAYGCNLAVRGRLGISKPNSSPYNKNAEYQRWHLFSDRKASRLFMLPIHRRRINVFLWLLPCALIHMRVESMSGRHLAFQEVITKSKGNYMRQSLESAAKRKVEETIFIYACVFTIEELIRVTLQASWDGEKEHKSSQVACLSTISFTFYESLMTKKCRDV